jgi:hypothetical protein
MNEIRLIMNGLIALVFLVPFFYFIDTMNVNMENREMNIVISLSIGLMILVIDKKQDRYINGIFTQQHKINW